MYTFIVIVTFWITQIVANILPGPGICTAHEPCAFDCTQPNSCEQGKLYCTAGQTCTIQCGGYNSCKAAQFFAQSATELRVTCSAKTSCGDATIDGTGAAKVAVSCSDVDSCKGDTEIICDRSECSVDCASETGCEELHIDRSKTRQYECTGAFCEFIGTVIPFQPTAAPTANPITNNPTVFPTDAPTAETDTPTVNTNAPSKFPTTEPTLLPASNLELPQVQGSILNQLTTTTKAPPTVPEATTAAPVKVYNINNLAPNLNIPSEIIPPGAGPSEPVSTTTTSTSTTSTTAASTTTTTAAPSEVHWLQQMPFAAKSKEVMVNDNNGVNSVVISFSAKTLRNIWILVIVFLVINGVISYFYCFKSRSARRYKETQIVFDEETISKV